MLPFSQFSTYWEAIQDLPSRESYGKADVLSERFLLCRDGEVSAYYVPFHHLSNKARIVIVGVTPCWTQVERSFSIAKRGQNEGLERKALFGHIDRAGRFNGPMRWNLIEMLNGIGLHHRLQIDSCAELFREAGDLAHFTSAVSAPVFRGNQHYTGMTPHLLKVAKLREFVSEYLTEELRALPNAVIIPLGDVPSEALRFLQRNGRVKLDRCIFGFPHPSGTNFQRRVKYEHGRKQWTEQLRAFFQADRKRRTQGGESLRLFASRGLA